MFLLQRPSARQLARLLERARDLPLSYAPVGLALPDVGTDSGEAAAGDRDRVDGGRGEADSRAGGGQCLGRSRRDFRAEGFRVAEERAVLGRGLDVFARAEQALREWRQFDLGWAGVYPANARLEPGTEVLVVASHIGFWSVHACRVVYLREPRAAAAGGQVTNSQVPQHAGADDAPRVAGFAYGTLTEHAETGEEIFQISHDPATDEVTYLVRAVSKERALLARLGFPFARALQDRFRRDSARALCSHVAGREMNPRRHV